MDHARLARNAKTIFANGALAALFAAVATQVYAIVVPTANALPLLALFFVVGVCGAWAATRLEARQQRTERSQEGSTESPPRTDSSAAEAERETGTVKWFDHHKGYGFIRASDGEELFVHKRSVRRRGQQRPALDDGQRVSFVAVEGERGWQAEDVVAE